jgi:hypothetical protein
MLYSSWQEFAAVLLEKLISQECSTLDTTQWRTEGGFGVFNPPPPEILKALQNRAKLNLIVKTVKNC